MLEASGANLSHEEPDALCGVGIYVASRSFGAFQRRELTFERHIT